MTTAVCQHPNMLQQLRFTPFPSSVYCAATDDNFEELQSVVATGSSMFEYDDFSLVDITLQPLTPAAFPSCYCSAPFGDVTSGLDGGSCDPMFGDDACPPLPSIDCIFGQLCSQSGTSFGWSETGDCRTVDSSVNSLNNIMRTSCYPMVAITDGLVDMEVNGPVAAVNHCHPKQVSPFLTPVPSSTSTSVDLEQLNVNYSVEADTWSWTESPSSLSPSLTDSDVGPGTCILPIEWTDDQNVVGWTSRQCEGSHEISQKAATRTTKKARKNSESSSSCVSTTSSSDCPRSVPMAPTGIQRRRREKSRTPHLWKFMRALLEDDAYNPEYIRWENRSDGVFRIVPGQSKHIAVLWGLKKKNPSMTFDKLSRSLRWCRKYGFLDDVPKNGRYPKKLCFRFAPFALEWCPDASISIPTMPARSTTC